MAGRQHLTDWINATRDHDADQTLTYHSWVSVGHKCVCVTVPKIACSRIKLTLHLLDGNPDVAHLGDVHDAGLRLASFDTEQIVEMLTSPAWFRFCFVRNPYDRLLSAYKTQVGNTWNQQYKWLKDDIKRTLGYPPDDGPERLVAFRDFVRYLHDAEDGVRRDGHFNAQTRVLVPDLIPYDFVGRFEAFQSDFVQVLRRLNAPPEIIATASEVKNATTRVLPAIAYDRKMAALAADLYGADFDAFGYDQDSWMVERG